MNIVASGAVRTDRIGQGARPFAEPIRLNEVRAAEKIAQSSVGRVEAERQFKFSLALVSILTAATLAAIATLPIGPWQGESHTSQVASRTVVIR